MMPPLRGWVEMFQLFASEGVSTRGAGDGYGVGFGERLEMNGFIIKPVLQTTPCPRLLRLLLKV